MENARYYIYAVDQVSIYSQVKPIEEQPQNGFSAESTAEEHLLALIEERKGYYFDREWYRFVILKTYHSKNAHYLTKAEKEYQP